MKIQMSTTIKELNQIDMQISSLIADEFHELSTIEVIEFINSNVNSKKFTTQLNENYNILEKNSLSDELIKEKLICLCIMLGFGRNRTIKILDKYEVNRTVYEKIRDRLKLKDSEIRLENEKNLSAIKFQSSARKKRWKEIEKVNWNELKEKYINGESPINLGKEYKISAHMIVQQLKDEDVFDELRSTLTKKAIAEENYKNIDNNVIIKIVKDNPLDSKDDWWIKTQKVYSWILRRHFFDKLDELDLNRTKDEINAIRSLKSKTMSNTDYAIKVNSYKAINEVFGSIDNLVKKYMTNELGSYSKIANLINSKTNADFEISERQVAKIITGSPKYESRKSAGQHQLYKFICKCFPMLEIIEEYSFTDTNKRIDIYIPELKIGFEFNGDYWHSENMIQHNHNKSAYDFHEERVNELKDLGIKLLYVWENDWNINYQNVEKAIVNKDWNSKLLNKYESDLYMDKSVPSVLPSKLRYEIMEFLRTNEIDFHKKNNSSVIEITDTNLIIDVPNYNSLAEPTNSLNFQKQCEKDDIELLTFLPWMDIYKAKEFLTYRLGMTSVVKVGARKCKVKVTQGITREEKQFFEENHILGYYNFRYVDKTISLLYNGQTVMSAMFTRKPESRKSELKRLVSSYGISVQGGASRLLKEYIRQTSDIDKIFTFSDCDLGFGNVYTVLGFELIERSREQLTWFNEELEIGFSNKSLVQIGADRLLANVPHYQPVGTGEGLPSNQEIVQEYGFIPIYDSGYKKWKLEIK